MVALGVERRLLVTLVGCLGRLRVGLEVVEGPGVVLLVSGVSLSFLCFVDEVFLVRGAMTFLGDDAREKERSPVCDSCLSLAHSL